MYVLMGFATHSGLAINQPGVNSSIGELSTFSLTFSKEKGFYSNTAIDPKIGLVSFRSTLDDEKVEVPSEYRDHVLEICQAVYDYTVTRPNIQIDHGELLNKLITDFSSEAEEFAMGPIVNYDYFYAPEWVSWKKLGSENSIRVWFSDPAFRNQFPEYEIVIVPPFLPLDQFFSPGSQVEQLLKEHNISEITEKLQTAKANNPESFIRIDLFDYHDQVDPNRVVPSAWGILVYGAMGNNIDAIKQALVDYILNSSHERDEWARILPDIFKRTEFVLAPAWKKMAIPNLVTQNGIQSPALSLDEVVTAISEAAIEYPTDHVKQNVTVMGFPYRSLALTAVGNIENRDGIFRIDRVFQDFINVPSTHHDFGRMSKKTQDWSSLMARVIHEAERFKEFDNIPTGMMRVIREGKIFLAVTFDNRHYLVLCKTSAQAFE